MKQMGGNRAGEKGATVQHAPAATDTAAAKKARPPRSHAGAAVPAQREACSQISKRWALTGGFLLGREQLLSTAAGAVLC